MTDATASTAQAAIDHINTSVQAFGQGDLPRVLECYAPDVVWKVPGASPMAGTYEGRDGLARFFEGCFEESQGTMRVELENVLANESNSIHFMRITASRDGEDHAFTIAEFGEHGDDGRARRNWQLPDDLATMDRLFR